MLRGCRATLAKVSAVAIRATTASSLSYEKRYRMLKRLTLSNVFNAVTEENRYTSLGILLERLSSNVGRRQYKLRSDLTRFLPQLKEMRLDWFDVKKLSREDFIALLGPEALNLNHAERAVLLAAAVPKVCGVLRKGIGERHSEHVCMNPGQAQHGWRCGQHGHLRDVYFEGKQKLNPRALELQRRPSLLSRVEERNGVLVEVRPVPDFSIVGRLKHEPNPRVWSSPSNPSFDVHVIGFEFRVHPDDPRAGPQIVDAAAEWAAHGEVVRHVLWEMLELYGVERQQQALDMQPYELGEPDHVNSYSSAFARRSRQPRTRGAQENSSHSTATDPIAAEDVVVEPVMAEEDAGQERSWFTPPLPQRFTSDGVPEILPFAPTFIVQCTFKPIEHVLGEHGSADDETVTRLLMQPIVELSCLSHPQACYWLSPEDEAKAMAHVVSFARRVPYAIPFNLYVRVDPSKLLRGDAGEVFRRERETRQAAKNKWFDLTAFTTNHPHTAGSDKHGDGPITYDVDVETSHSSENSHATREGSSEDETKNYFYDSPPKQPRSPLRAARGGDDPNPPGWT